MQTKPRKMLSHISDAFNTNILFLVQGFSEEKVGATGEKKRVLIKSEIRKYSSEALIRYQRDIIQRVAYLCALLQEAVRHDGEKRCLHWHNCANAAIVKTRDAGFDCIKNCETLLTWLRQFHYMKPQSEARQFPYFLNARKDGPLLLKQYPVLLQVINEFIDSNLETVSAKVVRDHLHERVIPNLIAILELDSPSVDEDELEDTELERFLCSCGLKCLSESTCLDIL
jgi:hypothetical protein